MSIFASPWMLFWLAAAAAPWIIHLWLRKRQQEISWGAMLWMLQALQQQSRPLRIWQWLLLLLRTAALILLALAVAQPLGCRVPPSKLTKPPQIQILVLDASGSMQAKRTSGGTRWQRAVDEAIEICQQASLRDQCILLRMDSLPQYIIAEPSGDVGLLKQSLQQSTCGCSIADWNAMESTLNNLVEKLKAEDEKRSIKITVWSDAQRVTWQPVANRTAVSESDLSRLAQLEFRNMQEANSFENVAVSSIDLPAQIPIASGKVEVQGMLRNFDDQKVANQVARLSVDGIVRESKSVSITPGTNESVSFQVMLSAGEHVVSINTDNDALPVDDTRWEVLTIHDRVRVAVLGNPDATPMLATALNPDPSEATFEVVQGSADDASILQRQKDLIFLCDPPRISSATVEALSRQLTRGASIWYWCGPRGNANQFNRLLWEQSQPKLLPAKLGDVANVGLFQLDPLEYQHPIISAFAEYPDAGLTTVPVFRYRNFESPLPNAQVVLSIDQGKPFCLVAPHESGGAVGCIAVPADVGKMNNEAWTGFAAWPSFLPFVQNIARWSLTQGQAKSVTVGSSIEGRGGESTELTKPDGSKQRVTIADSATKDVWRLSRTDQVGIYRYHDSVQDRAIAVNVDLAESDLATVDWGTIEQRYPSNAQTEPINELAAQEMVQEPLFRFALGGALGFLMLEMSVIAWLQRRFG